MERYNPKLLLMGLDTACENNMYKRNEKELELILQIVEDGLLVTKELLDNIDEDTIRDAMELISDYNYTTKYNIFDEMKRVGILKDSLAVLETRKDIALLDEDYF